MSSFKAEIKFILNGNDGHTYSQKIKGKTPNDRWVCLNDVIVEQLKSRVSYEYSFTICINNIGDGSSSSTVSNAQELHGMIHKFIFSQQRFTTIHHTMPL